MSQHTSEVGVPQGRGGVAPDRVAAEFPAGVVPGSFRPDLLPEYPIDGTRPEFKPLYDKLRHFFAQEVDPVEIDETGEYPQHVLDALTEMGAFGLLVPKEYGGHGLNKIEWCKLMELLASFEGNLLGLLSPHQSVGVPETIKQFGTPEQKKKYLTRCAAGDISAFALTEPDVGSDPARMATTATLTPDGDVYILNGVKLWCTNGTLAKLLIVMAKHPDTKKISAFVVEMDWPGVEVTHRCRFGTARVGERRRSIHQRACRRKTRRREGKGLKIARRCSTLGGCPCRGRGGHGEEVRRFAASGRTSACSGGDPSASTRRSRTCSPT